MAASKRKIWKDNSGITIFHKGGVYHAGAELLPKGKTLNTVEVSDLKAAGYSLVKDPERIGSYRFIGLDADAVEW